ncbi:MAG TPA: hypothetical protein PKK10_07145 [Woeseiaceae bacterium]|nr:hypothetical protein [Woeseiaceae bacterium]
MMRTGARIAVVAVILATSGQAMADNNFGIGVKAGTLGAGLEGTWRPLPYMDVRVGANLYEFKDSGSQAGINYDGALNLESYYGTLSVRVPLSPLRLTTGAFSNGNELTLVSSDNDLIVDIGGTAYAAAEVGTLSSSTSFSGVAPYLGIGLDFTLFNKVGLNFDVGVLWQGDPTVSLLADGPIAGDPAFQTSLELERKELLDEVSDYKAWPVLSIGFNYNF